MFISAPLRPSGHHRDCFSLLFGLNRTEKHVKTFLSINLNEASRAPFSSKRKIEFKQILYAQWNDTLARPDVAMNANDFVPQSKPDFISHQVKFIAFRSTIERWCDGVTHAFWILIMDWVDALATLRHRRSDERSDAIRIARFMLANWSDLLLHFHLCSGRCSTKSFFPLFITLLPRSIRSGLAFDFNWHRAIKRRCSFRTNEFQKFLIKTGEKLVRRKGRKN